MPMDIEETHGKTGAECDGKHWHRLHAMISDKSQADWGLNAEDEAAIKWAIDTLLKQRDQRVDAESKATAAQDAFIRLKRSINAKLDDLKREVL